MSEAESDYYAHANAVFVDVVVAGHHAAPRILDVGCWNGTLGRQLISRCGAVVDGIEKESTQAAKATSNGYRRVYTLDLDASPLDVVNQTYDFILFGDVLEHLLHPERVLAMLVQRLAPGGVVMVSLPNIAFIGCRLTHLLGRWDYADYGILDRTHLRFYTRRTMIEMIQACGLSVQSVQGYVGLRTYPWFVKIAMRWLGRMWPTMFAIQIVISAEISPACTS